MKRFMKLTSFDGTETIVNLDKVIYFDTVTRNEKVFTRIIFEENKEEFVKENCYLIYNMINS